MLVASGFLTDIGLPTVFRRNRVRILKVVNKEYGLTKQSIIYFVFLKRYFFVLFAAHNNFSLFLKELYESKHSNSEFIYIKSCVLAHRAGI